MGFGLFMSALILIRWALKQSINLLHPHSQSWMEHLPPGPEGHQSFDIPYVCVEEYDGGDFFDYPNRCCWSEDDLMGYQSFGGKLRKEVEAFFQTWLYFGFVISLFRVVKITVKTSDFIRVADDGKKFISTHALQGFIKQWIDREDISHPSIDSYTPYTSDKLKRIKGIVRTFDKLRLARGKIIRRNLSTTHKLKPRVKVIKRVLSPMDKLKLVHGRALKRILSPSDKLKRARRKDIESLLRTFKNLKRERGMVIKKILNRTIRFVNMYCHANSSTMRFVEMASDADSQAPRLLQSENGPPFWPISPEIAMSMMALTDSLCSVAESLYNLYEMRSMVGGTSSCLNDRLKKQGWCVSETPIFKANTTIGVEYYFTSYPSPRKLLDHSECKQAICKAKNVKVGEYRTKHVIEGCRCADQMNLPEILAIMDKQGIPLVTFVDGKLNVVQYDEKTEMKYVAMSHVWSDGLGNEKKNSLPTCQLKRIQHLVDCLYAEQHATNIPSFNHEREWQTLPKGSTEVHIPFWMDTLCIPLIDKYRKLAIRQMRIIYRFANAVLVLDSYVQAVPRSANITDKAIRLYLSNWHRRLWTLQEGLFASTLFFQFQDGPQTIFDLEKELSSVEDNLPNYYADVGLKCFYDFHPFYHSLNIEEWDTENGSEQEFDGMEWRPRRFNEFAEDEDSQAHSMFQPVAGTICGRSTTKLEDEWICFSTLLGLNPAALFSSPKDKAAPTTSGPDEKEVTSTAIGPVNDEALPTKSGSIDAKPLAVNLNPDDAGKVVQTVLVRDEVRAERFYKLVKYFLPDLIFNNLPRLKRDGFRWAPRSYIDQLFSDLYTVGPTTLDAEELGDDGGLPVTYSGINLGAVGPHLGTHVYIVRRKEPSYWYGLRLYADDEEKYPTWSVKKQYVVVTAHTVKKYGKDVEGILGTIEGEDEDERVKVRHLCRAKVEQLKQEDLVDVKDRSLAYRSGEKQFVGGEEGFNGWYPVWGHWSKDADWRIF